MLNDLENNLNKEVLIAGVVTEGENRLTKRGDQFGTMIIEDYSDSTKLFLWRENYLKFKHFLSPGTFVAVKGRIEIPRRRNEPEFTIHSIELLEKLKETKANGFYLKLNTSDVKQGLIEDLNKIFVDHKGTCPVHFTIYDPVDKLEIKMPSRTVRVSLNSDLFKKLEKLEDLQFEIK